MVKYCKHDGCEETLMEWQTYCYQHNKTEEKNMEIPNYPMPPPEYAQQPQEVKKEIPVPKPPVVQQTQVEQPSQMKKSSPKFQVKGEVPKLDDRSRLIAKQVAFKEATSLLPEIENLETANYKQLLEVLETLTIDFYKIIVARNEQN